MFFLRGPKRDGVTRINQLVEFTKGLKAAFYEPFGRVYYVDKLNGSDTFNGRSPSDAKATIVAAITVMNARINWTTQPWAKNDVLYIAPGRYDENLTSLPYGCRVIGLGDAFDLDGERGVTIQPTAGSPIDCTSVINCRIENICFKSPDTDPVFQADNFNRNVLLDCLFAGVPGGSPTTTKGLEVVKDMTGNRITNCVFLVARNGIYINTDNANSKQASGNIIEHCHIYGADQKGIYFDANTVPSYSRIDNCIIGDGSTTLALGLDDQSGIVGVSNTNIQAAAINPAHGGGGKYNNCYFNGTLITQA